MTATEIVTLILGASAFVSALSVLYSKFIKPIRALVKEIEHSKEQIADIKDDLKAVHKTIEDGNEYNTENRARVMKSLVAVLDGLEQNGANGVVTKTKKELIEYMAENLNGKITGGKH